MVYGKSSLFNVSDLLIFVVIVEELFLMLKTRARACIFKFDITAKIEI